MPRHRSFLSWLVAAIALCAGASTAFALVAPAPDDTPVAARPLPRLAGGAAPLRLAVTASLPEGALDPVARRHDTAALALERLGGVGSAAGAPQVRWNAWTGLPHRLWGTGIAIPVAGRLD